MKIELKLWNFTPRMKIFPHAATITLSSSQTERNQNKRTIRPQHKLFSLFFFFFTLPLKNWQPRHFQEELPLFILYQRTTFSFFHQLYRPVSVRVMLVGVDIWSYKDQIDVSTNPEVTLGRFLDWRQRSLLPWNKHDNAQFITYDPRPIDDILEFCGVCFSVLVGE